MPLSCRPNPRAFFRVHVATAVWVLLWSGDVAGQSGRLSGQLTIPSEASEAFQTRESQFRGGPSFALAVRTNLLSGFVKRETVENNDVATRVLEADVRGVQTTTTAIRLQSVESRRMARFDIIATGTVSSNTVGYTPQARITTAGSHTFDVRKPVYFDGQQFLTKPAYGSLQARQFPQAVNSVASGMPLFGQLGDQIAWSEVYRRMPESDAVVVRRVAEDVLPKVNRGVDKELARLNQQWSVLRQTIDRFAPNASAVWQASTTRDEFRVSIADERDIGVAQFSNPVSDRLDGPECVACLVSQQAINSLLVAQPLGGLTVSDMALQGLFTSIQNTGKDPAGILRALQENANRNVEPKLFSLHLADDHPLELAFEQGLLIVRLRFQVQPKSAPASQMHLMQIRLGGQSDSEGTWSVALKQISVEPDDSSALPDAWTTLINNQAAQMVQAVPPSDLPRSIDLTRFNPDLPMLRIHRIQSEDGWFRISLREVSTAGSSEIPQ